MRDLTALAALHAELDEAFEVQRQDATSSRDSALVERIETKQRLNDQAYFVLCWGQFETEVDDRCRQAIRAKIASSDWQTRRAWDLYNPDDKRLSGLRFEDRLAIVLDQRAGRASPYARAIGYYSLRNSIAHGRLRPDRIDLQAVVSDFHVILAAFAHWKRMSVELPAAMLTL